MKEKYEKSGFFLTRALKDWVLGDGWTKLTPIMWGLGYMGHGQIIKGLLATVFEAVIIAFTMLVGVPYLQKFGTLGTQKREAVFNPVTMKNDVIEGDNSFLILLFSVLTFVILFAALVVLCNMVSESRKLQLDKEQGRHINNFREDIKEMFNQKFHLTLLFMPCLGVVLFTILPIIFMVLIAFTNYDEAHMPPTDLFTWVGFDNFKNLVNMTQTGSFGYAFVKILGWTIVWAIFATFTTYIGGILLSMFINSKDTKFPKFWRTLFVITIAVPQFVSLLLVRNFFAKSGIVNTICSELGITEFLQNIGLVGTNIDYIPFLNDPNWAKVMVILINIWIGVPYLMLIATGVLMNIPADLYESAKIDGANGWQRFWKITMPYMLSVTGPYLVTSFMSNINNFNVIYLLTNDVYVTIDPSMAQAHGQEIDLLVTWLYRLTNDYYNYKMASVIGMVIFLICAVVTLIFFNYTIKGDKEDQFKI